MANVWAIGDLHLSFALPHKSMSIFGPAWENHTTRIQKTWDEKVSSEDLVVIPGDISWAMKLEDALVDLQWIHERPGTKVIIKGNHDMWWDSISKLRKNLPSSIHAIQNDTFQWKNVYIAGSRLWDSEEYSFESVIDFKPNPKAIDQSCEGLIPKKTEEQLAKDQEIFKRELMRLEESLKRLPAYQEPSLESERVIRLSMTHYPPIGLTAKSTFASKLFAQYHVNCVVYGHLHSLSHDKLARGEKEQCVERIQDGIYYHLTSCDWLNCSPKLIIQDSQLMMI